jgi:hypothetical protein
MDCFGDFRRRKPVSPGLGDAALLNWISDPWIYRQSISQFGFVYHPLFKSVGGDIVLLRQANVLIVFAMACVLCSSCFDRLLFSGITPAHRNAPV